MAIENPALGFLRGLASTKIQTVESLIEKYTSHLLLEAGISKFPVDVAKILSRYDLSSKPKTLREAQRGLITPNLDIYFNSSDLNQVQTFTQGHEIMELLYYALLEHDAECIDTDSVTKFLDHKEYYCDFGSAMLLMPTHLFSPEIEALGMSLTSAKILAQKSGLSLTAVCRRAVEVTRRKCALVIWKFTHKTSEYIPSSAGQQVFWDDPTLINLPKKLRVEKRYSSSTMKDFIRVEKSVGEDTSIFQTWTSHNGSIKVGYDYLEITKRHDCYLTESIRVTHGDQPKVLSFIYFDDFKDKQV